MNKFGQKVVVRMLTFEDADQYQNLRLAALKQNPEAFGSTYNDEAKRTQVVVKNILGKNVVFGAFVDNQMVGQAKLSVKKFQKLRHIGRVFGMFVLEDFRRHGIAKKLIDAIEIYAKKLGIEQLQLKVIASNLAAEKLYETMGFVVYAKEKQAIKIGPLQYEDELWMVRFLA